MRFAIMKKYVFRPILGLALAAPLTLAGCVQNADYDVLRSQVTQHEQALQQLNMQLSGVQPAQADTWSQVQAMRQEIAALRGEVDTMSHSFQQAGGAQAMADLLSRHDRALHLIETQLAMDLQLSETAATPGIMGAPAVSSGTPGSSVVTAPPAANRPAEASPARPAIADTAQALYDSGMASFNSRNYQQALKAFTDFTATYPQHKLVSNAWFWQGESNFQMKNYAAAALAYEKVISGYPNSNKAPAAYLKQGMSFLQLDRKDAARERLNQLIQKFPKAPEATRARQVLGTIR